ncbi:hypothetical protein IGI04_011490 [Brassica rapa subsp. trilocularis]|uniref:Transmembrane protein n=1 Tax=Brassica rapa subsp. trilocularis TaxID=1813537 RepID=A0ABQ7N5F2_BRACM|nr:hypothetical protein IGI04_011490 [Brassica rapa subsp. trilocularis]
MEKLSVKFAFIALLAVACVMMTTMTVQNAEASRLLPEETPVVHYEASTQIVKPQDFHCREGCRVSCIPIQLIIRCVCLC